MDAHVTTVAAFLRAGLALLAVGILAAGLLAGCGSDDEEPATESAQTSSAGSTEADPAATGGGGEPDTGEPEAARPEVGPLTPAQLTDIAGRVLTSGDPKLACEELVSQRLVRDAYGDRSGCAAAQVPGSVAERVRFSGIDISADSAVVTAVPAGGVSDGIELTVRLVRSEDGWLVDSLAADVPVGP